MNNNALAIATVTKISGKSWVINQYGETTPLQIGDKITEGNTVKTDIGAHARITFTDASSLLLSESTSMKIDQYLFDAATENGKAEISFLGGGFLAIGGKIAENQPEDFALSTPVATIGIRGTVVMADMDGSRCLIVLLEGKIDATNVSKTVAMNLPFQGAEFWVKGEKAGQVIPVERVDNSPNKALTIKELSHYLRILEPKEISNIQEKIYQQSGGKIQLETDGETILIQRKTDLQLTQKPILLDMNAAHFGLLSTERLQETIITENSDKLADALLNHDFFGDIMPL